MPLGRAAPPSPGSGHPEGFASALGSSVGVSVVGLAVVLSSSLPVLLPGSVLEVSLAVSPVSVLGSVLAGGVPDVVSVEVDVAGGTPGAAPAPGGALGSEPAVPPVGGVDAEESPGPEPAVPPVAGAEESAGGVVTFPSASSGSSEEQPTVHSRIEPPRTYPRRQMRPVVRK